MKVAVGLLLACAAFAEQKAPSRLLATLKKLHDSPATRAVLTEELTEDILALAEVNHEPSRGSVGSLANELVNALYHRTILPNQVEDVNRSILEILRPTGSTAQSATRLRQVLLFAGAERPDVVTKRFIVVAEEVRGPDDSPVLPSPRLK
jgi:hypothetical protein